jgi:hypothetical protein
MNKVLKNLRNPFKKINILTLKRKHCTFTKILKDMKTQFRIMPVLMALLMVIGLNSCDKKTDDNPGKGKLRISISMADDLNAKKSGVADSSIYDTTYYSSYQLLVSVADMNGVFVLEDKLVPVYSFGSGFISDQIEIQAGEFFLRKFMVINNYGQVIYASPIEGSPRAYLVNQPLPLYFSVNPNETTQVAPEVLPVDGYNPTDFGYASFMVQVVKPISFYAIAMLDNPLLMVPTLYTDAELYVYTPDGWSHNFRLEPIVNLLEVRSSEYYEMIVYKDGFQEQRLTVSIQELLQSTKENPFVIKIGSSQNWQTLILQPGPDEGKDALISNLEPDKNFGDSRYFEASFLPEPVLTVMRSNQSLMAFSPGQLPKSAVIKSVLLTLYYEAPLYWKDSLNYANFDRMMPPFYGAALQQIVEPWEEGKVTWNNQPKSTEMNQVMINPFVLNANFITVDVTSLFVQNPYIDSIPLPNYGMMLKLFPAEGQFPGFRFLSSDYPEEYMRPSLIIQYSIDVYGGN